MHPLCWVKRISASANGRERIAVKPGRPVIALIEDEPLLRVPVAHGLDQASYNVISAASAAEGLSVLDNPDVELAVVDLKLPGRLDGVAVVREAKARNSRLK